MKVAYLAADVLVCLYFLRARGQIGDEHTLALRSRWSELRYAEIPTQNALNLCPRMTSGARGVVRGFNW